MQTSKANSTPSSKLLIIIILSKFTGALIKPQIWGGIGFLFPIVFVPPSFSKGAPLRPLLPVVSNKGGVVAFATSAR